MHIQYKSHYESPIGGITLGSDGTALCGVWFDDQKYVPADLPGTYTEQRIPVFAEADRWFDIYFSGRIPDFTPQLHLEGSPFRKIIWELLLDIPYGHTMTYGKIAALAAQQMGIEKMSAQAAGGAVGHNPVSLIVPCHRVIGADGSLTGYAGGIDRKRKLLELETKTML